MLGLNLKREIDQIAKDKGIDANEIIAALEEAMVQAAQRRHGADREFEARYNDELGEIVVRPRRVSREPCASLVNTDRSLENLHDRRVHARTALYTQLFQTLRHLVRQASNGELFYHAIMVA